MDVADNFIPVSEMTDQLNQAKDIYGCAQIAIEKKDQIHEVLSDMNGDVMSDLNEYLKSLVSA